MSFSNCDKRLPEIASTLLTTVESETCNIKMSDDVVLVLKFRKEWISTLNKHSFQKLSLRNKFIGFGNMPADCEWRFLSRCRFF